MTIPPEASQYGRGVVIQSRYELRDPLASGGNGRIFSAWDRQGQSEVVVKLYEGSVDDPAYARLENEGLALEHLAHRNEALVPVLDVLKLPDALVIVLPRLRGANLLNWLRARGEPLTWTQAVKLLYPVARALSFAHSNGIIHRDVKPANVFLEFSPQSKADLLQARVRLIDFGIARLPREVSVMQPTDVDVLVGSLRWCAPEQVPLYLRERYAPELVTTQVGPCTDIYGFATTLFYALTLQPYLDMGHFTEEQACLSVLLEPPELQRLPTPTPTLARRLLVAALAKHPKLRPQSFEPILRAMEGDMDVGDRSKGATSQPSAPLSPYERRIDRQHPCLVLVLVDQSGSMRDRFGGNAARSKAEAVADVVNEYLDGLIASCQRSGGEIRELYQVAIIGYQDADGPRPKDLLAKPIMGMAELDAAAQYEARQNPGGQGTFDFPVWIKPSGAGMTPMCAALEHARALAARWIEEHPDCFPPVIFNVTDGASTDGDPLEKAQQIKSLPGGPVILCGHLSHKRSEPILFPYQRPDPLPDPYAETLWKLSSELPQPLLDNLLYVTGQPYPRGTRGYMFNVTEVDHIRRLLKAGTPRAR